MEGLGNLLDQTCKIQTIRFIYNNRDKFSICNTIDRLKSLNKSDICDLKLVIKLISFFLVFYEISVQSVSVSVIDS